MAAGAGAKAVLKHVGKAVIRDVALGAVTDAGVETARQLVTGTRITNLEYDRITEAGVYGGISGGASSLAGAGLEGLMKTRLAQSAIKKVNLAASKGTDAIKTAFRRVVADNSGVLDFDAFRKVGKSGTNTVKELVVESDAAKKWGISEDGTNQGVKHFSDYWEKYPERIPSLEQRLGVPESAFKNSLDGFNNFTTQAERVINEATSNGTVRDINGKTIYYIDGAVIPKKGVAVIVRDGKIQSMMPSDLKSFNKMQ